MYFELTSKYSNKNNKKSYTQTQDRRQGTWTHTFSIRTNVPIQMRGKKLVNIASMYHIEFNKTKMNVFLCILNLCNTRWIRFKCDVVIAHACMHARMHAHCVIVCVCLCLWCKHRNPCTPPRHKSGKILFNRRIHRLVAVKMKRHSLLVSW